MARYLLSRILQFALVIFGAVVFVFLALYVVADPARTAFPVGTPPETIEAFREANGFNDPILNQLGRHLGAVFTLDFGDSIWLRQDALDAVLERLPATLILASVATLVAALLATLSAMFGARRVEHLSGRLVNAGSFLAVSIPEFWLGIMAILLFSVHLGWLPTGGISPMPWALIMPVLVLMLRPFGRVFQVARNSMLAEYNKQYVMTARSRGLNERQVVRRHVLRNAAVPVTTLVFYELGRVFVGTAIIVEVVFAWPGIGRLAVGALERGDIFLIEAIVAVAAIAVASFNLLADVLYFAIDPRTRSLVERA